MLAITAQGVFILNVCQLRNTDAHCAVRSVKHNGQVHFKGKFIYVSESLAKEKIGIDQTEQGDYIAYFYNLALGKIDPSKGKFIRFTPHA